MTAFARVHRSFEIWAVTWALVGVCCHVVSVAHAQDQAPAEVYRIQITNTNLGAVELSIDGGKTWVLAARVSRPASANREGGKSNAQEVQSSSLEGVSFGAAFDRLISVLPNSAANQKNKAAILLNVPNTSALFKDFMPPVGSSVKQIVNKTPLNAFETSPYSPKDGDVIQIIATKSPFIKEKIADYAQDVARYYRDRAIARLRAAGRKPTSGILVVTAKLRPGNVPNAVTFLLDGNITGIMNHSPFDMRFDTHDWSNGEHVVEIRALSTTGDIVSRTKTLVVVDNSARTP